MTTKDAVLQDFESALTRLLAGTPTDARLADQAVEGKLRVSFLNIAIEAKHSRTLIAHDGCRYPEFRVKVQRLLEDNPRAVQTRKALVAAKTRIRELEEAVRAKDSIMAALIVELSTLRGTSGVTGSDKVTPFRKSPASG